MGWIEPVVFLLGVIMGTGSTLTIKIIYGLEAIGVSGEYQRFEKPLFTTWIMFLGMSIALPLHYIVRWHNRRQHYHSIKMGRPSATELDDQDVPWRTFFLLVIPSCFDLFGTALSGVGLLFTTVSVYQLVRCSVIIFTAILKATVLGQKLSNYMWFGIFINTVSMVLVSSTSFIPGASPGGEQIDAQGNSRDPRIGIMFIVASCLVQGSQYVFEEKVMTVDNAPPLVVVGMEGLWGTILMPLVVFPWAFILPGTDVGGCVENLWDSFIMTSNSTSIQLVLGAFCLTVWFYNMFCIYVTFLLNSIWHAILDNFRPVSVWATDLLLFYVFTNGAFGEQWTKYSWIEFLGMVLLFIGTAVYDGSIRVPGFEYPTILPSHGGETPTESINPSLSSPALLRSPLINRSLLPQRDLNTEFGGPLINGSKGGYGSVNTEVHASSHQQQSHSRKK